MRCGWGSYFRGAFEAQAGISPLQGQSKPPVHTGGPDFISKMEDLLNDMRDTEAPKLVKELNEFSLAIKQAVEAFQSQDAQYAKMMGGNKDGK